MNTILIENEIYITDEFIFKYKSEDTKVINTFYAMSDNIDYFMSKSLQIYKQKDMIIKVATESQKAKLEHAIINHIPYENMSHNMTSKSIVCIDREIKTNASNLSKYDFYKIMSPYYEERCRNTHSEFSDLYKFHEITENDIQKINDEVYQEIIHKKQEHLESCYKLYSDDPDYFHKEADILPEIFSLIVSEELQESYSGIICSILGEDNISDSED